MNRSLVVVGDALLDRDVTGQVNRISPDAPVPVFDEGEGRDRPGGAALTAALAAAGGRPVVLVTAIGADAAGTRLRELLTQAGVTLRELPYQGDTPQKIRLYAGGQVVLRLDRGASPGRPGEPDSAALAALRSAGSVLVSDYGRGISRLGNLRRVLASLAANRPVVWDPHPRGSAPVPGLRLVTPNEDELHAVPDGAAADIPGGRLAGAAARAAAARRTWRAGAVAVTLGADGALLAQGGTTPLVVPPPVRASGDTCGAGDRFAASAAQALADGALVSEAVQIAVGDAARFVAAGAARAYTQAEPDGPDIDEADLGAELGDTAPPAGIGLAQALAVAGRTRSQGGVVVATGGCFDLLHPGHVATLQAARQLGDCLIVCLNSDRSVRQLKGPDRPLVTQDDRARLVAALSCVDAVAVFDETTPVALLSQLRPDVWVKGGDYYLDDPDSQPVLPEAQLIRGWGGQSVVVPYLDGHSTTSLIRAARKHVGGNR
ncbi:MAG: D-beta-D-heptose 7-phosphate kinase / D-beta-D-heptose 1-phosphate adenosyltransferase [Micromonosporaceae bacterium]